MTCFETLTWVDPDGGEWDLVPEGFPNGVTGRFMPPVTVTVGLTPGIPGGQIDDVQVDPRRVVVSAVFVDESEQALRDHLRALTAALYPAAGVPGVLRGTIVGSGAQREIDALYELGLGLDETWVAQRGGPTSDGRWYQMAGLTFLCVPDPMWRGTTDAVHPFAAATPTTFFPFFPLVLTGSEVLDTATLTNDGDVDAYPVWTLTGPFNGATLVNVTTGERLGVSSQLLAGETLTVDTTPGVTSIVDQDGVSRFAEITTDRDFWTLPPGDTEVRIEMAELDVAASDASVTWRVRYLTA